MQPPLLCNNYDALVYCHTRVLVFHSHLNTHNSTLWWFVLGWADPAGPTLFIYNSICTGNEGVAIYWNKMLLVVRWLQTDDAGRNQYWILKKAFCIITERLFEMKCQLPFLFPVQAQLCVLLQSTKDLLSHGAFCPKLLWQEYRRDKVCVFKVCQCKKTGYSRSEQSRLLVWFFPRFIILKL